MTTTKDRVIELVEKLYKECEADGTLKTQELSKYIYYERFKAFVRKHIGIDKATIYNWRDTFAAYKFLEFDEYGRVFFIYWNSPDYSQNMAKPLRGWFNGE